MDLHIEYIIRHYKITTDTQQVASSTFNTVTTDFTLLQHINKYSYIRQLAPVKEIHFFLNDNLSFFKPSGYASCKMQRYLELNVSIFFSVHVHSQNHLSLTWLMAWKCWKQWLGLQTKNQHEMHLYVSIESPTFNSWVQEMMLFKLRNSSERVPGGHAGAKCKRWPRSCVHMLVRWLIEVS